MARRYGKRVNQKSFLEEASALIELVNLVNSFRLKHKNHNDSCNYDCKTKGRKELRRNRQGAARENSGSSGHAREQAARFKPTVRHEAKKHHRSTRKNSTVEHRNTKSVTLSYPCTKKLKRNYKRQTKNLQPKRDKDFDQIKAKLQALQRCTSISNQNKDICSQNSEKERRRQLLYDLDKMKYVRIYSVKDLLTLSKNAEMGKTTVLLKSADNPKCDLKTWKVGYNTPDSQLFNKKSSKRCTENRMKEKKSHEKDSKKSTVQNPSLQLMLNLRIKTSANNINLEIKTKKKSRKLHDNDPNVLDFRLPYQYDSSTRRDQMNRQLMNILSTKLSKSSTEKSSRKFLMQRSNNHEMQFLKQQHHARNPKLPDTPYSKTQAVYNLYDVTQFRSGVMRGLKSNVHFNLNIGKGANTADTMSTDGTRTFYTQSGRTGRELRYKNKVDFNSGSTSLQQSVLLGRKIPQTELALEPCDCEPFECDPSLSDPQQLESSFCETCCQALEEEEYEPPPKVSYITALKRAKQRMVDRVANVTYEAATTPRAFMKRIYDKYSGIDDDVAQRDVGVCTCKRFMDTDEVSVLEENVDPDCTFLKRIFGSLLFNDECVVCNAEREVRKREKFVCEPGICIEPTGLFACVRKFCGKFKKKKKVEVKDKRSPICKFICSLFCKNEDEDQRKLLKGKAKTKTHKKGDDDRRRRRDDDEPRTKQGLSTGRRQFRRATKRIRERYYRNKKLAEQQKGQFACDFYLMSLRNKPCLWVYYMCPFCYPHCLQALNIWRQVSDLLLFFVAILVWSPCILTAELVKVMLCNMCW